MLLGIIATVEYFHVAGEKSFRHFSTVRHYLDHYLIFWKKILTSDNIVLAVLPRAVVSKFVAVGSLYGIKT